MEIEQLTARDRLEVTEVNRGRLAPWNRWAGVLGAGAQGASAGLEGP